MSRILRQRRFVSQSEAAAAQDDSQPDINRGQLAKVNT